MLSLFGLLGATNAVYTALFHKEWEGKEREGEEEKEDKYDVRN